jgi:TolB protein
MNATDGSDIVRLTNNQASDVYPAWSPDGGRIAFVSVSLSDNNHEIYIMSTDGSGLERLTNNLAVDHFPAWKPNE